MLKDLIKEKITLRPEIKSDYNNISMLLENQFESKSESLLVESIRRGESYVPELAIVAEAGRSIIGYIISSRISINNNGNLIPILALGPLCITGAFQGFGIGSLLINYTFKEAKELGYDSIIVVGHKNFYQKFGFRPASQWKIECPFAGVPEESFMAVELTKNALKESKGQVNYPSEFF